MPGTLSKHAKREEEDHILYMYNDDEDCGFETKDKSGKWGRWKSTILQMTPELRESIMGHPELRSLLGIFESGKGNKPVSLRSTAKNLVALRTTEPQFFPIESVLFCPNRTLEVEWKSFPRKIFWDMPEIKECKEEEEIRNLKRIMNEESIKIETLGKELNAALKKLQSLDISDAPRRKRQPGVAEKTAADEIGELREKFNQDIGSILGRLRHGPQFGAAENIANVEGAQPVSDADQIPIAIGAMPESGEVADDSSDDVQGDPVVGNTDHNDQNMEDIGNKEQIFEGVLVRVPELEERNIACDVQDVPPINMNQYDSETDVPNEERKVPNDVAQREDEQIDIEGARERFEADQEIAAVGEQDSGYDENVNGNEQQDGIVTEVAEFLNSLMDQLP